MKEEIAEYAKKYFFVKMMNDPKKNYTKEDFENMIKGLEVFNCLLLFTVFHSALFLALALTTMRRRLSHRH